MSQIKISVSQLKIGMYVSQLDRPWVETPFLFQGFSIKDAAMIAELTKHCKQVYVDDEQGMAPDEKVIVVPTEKTEDVVVYIEDEIPKARQIHKSITQEFKNVVAIIQTGGHVDVAAISREVEHLVEGCLRNTDAYLLLSKLKSKDDYTYSHCLSSSIFAVMMGRQMGLNNTELEELAFGHMFFDIGKIKLPNELINKPGIFSDEEKETVKKHVFYSVEILNTMQGVKSSAIDMALNHHERFDGSGYPHGLKGNQIPLYARIAGIIDTYDAVTSKRSYSRQVSHDEAIRMLYKSKDTDFQKDILETFIQCLGTYPSGSLVELSSGEVGIVLQQNRISRLRPSIMLVLNARKEFNDYFPIINLLTKPTDKNGKVMEISKLLEPGSYGIDPAEFYLQMTGTTSR